MNWWFFFIATECRTFLLYYLPLLCGILPDKYLAHALLLSKAMRLLLGDQLSHADIEIAENLLRLFWRLTEKLYGQRLNLVHTGICLFAACYLCLCYIELYGSLYLCAGLKHCKINIHLLSHLPHFVRKLGPLWTHSAFAFEDSIGYLVKKSHGTHDVVHQVKTFIGIGFDLCDNILLPLTIDSNIISTSVAATCEAKAFAGSSTFQVLW